MSEELRELSNEPFRLTPISWLSFDIAIAAGAGIVLSFAYVDFSENRGRSPNLVEQIVVAFAFIFLVNLFVKYFVEFLQRKVSFFDIYYYPDKNKFL